jgi:hypothetical protein
MLDAERKHRQPEQARPELVFDRLASTNGHSLNGLCALSCIIVSMILTARLLTNYGSHMHHTVQNLVTKPQRVDRTGLLADQSTASGRRLGGFRGRLWYLMQILQLEHTLIASVAVANKSFHRHAGAHSPCC